ncbi:Molybdenum carrier [Balamuthia mandrillaris]
MKRGAASQQRHNDKGEDEASARTHQRRNKRTSGGGGRPDEKGWGSSSSVAARAAYSRREDEPQTRAQQRGGNGYRGRGGRGRGRGRGGESGTEETPVERGRVTPVEEWAGKVVKIISGGQTGADRAGLEAGRLLGIATGGTAPSNFLTERGPDQTLKRLFGLTADGDLSYAARTRKNVDDADGTIAFRLHEGNGTDKTIGWAHLRKWSYGPWRGQSKEDGWRPVLVIDDVSDERMEENCRCIHDWVVRNQIAIINIAGHRETTSGMGEVYAQQVTKMLQLALADLA